MAYFYYGVTFIFLLTATVFYVTRQLWLPYAPPIPYITAPGTIPEPIFNAYHWTRSLFTRPRYVRLSTSFQGDAEDGFTSANFDLADNIEAGDSRQGLDDRGKAAVQRIMNQRKVGFDEARRMWMEERFGRENIGKDGRPRDPKAVMFDR